MTNARSPYIGNLAHAVESTYLAAGAVAAGAAPLAAPAALQDFLSPEQDFLSPEQDFFSPPVAVGSVAAAGVAPPHAAVPRSMPATAETARTLPMFMIFFLTLRTQRFCR